ncbi:MAG: hypothetical protein HN337_09080 [Deltaproteobacteria bacterium]|jgi:hypothetical protein|nr:hypothetical protein [Deltaproteobacteria bacterium]
MQTEIKKIDTAILTNALVLPGIGYFILGQRLKGILISAITIILLILPLAKYTLSVLSDMKGLYAGSPVINQSLSALSRAWKINQSFIIYCLIGIVALWVFCLLDLMIMKKKIKRVD